MYHYPNKVQYVRESLHVTGAFREIVLKGIYIDIQQTNVSMELLQDTVHGIII